jgi:pyridinium-3,5-biscarboxylic acid mononucleotide synthase
LPEKYRAVLDYDPVSQTAFFGQVRPPSNGAEIAVITAGTSDVPVASEATRTLRFHGHDVLTINDVGVAGLWRLFDRLEALTQMSVVITVAGMDGALPSVVAGLVSGSVIAVPTSVGYGVANGGQTALHAALASCAPGLVVVNIDNGYGAACAALRIVQQTRTRSLLRESRGGFQAGNGVGQTNETRDTPP